MFAIYEGSMGINSKHLIQNGFETLESAKEAFVAWIEEKGHEIADIEKDDAHDAYDALVLRKGGWETSCYTIEAV